VTLTASGPARAPTRVRRLGPPLLLAAGVLAASVALHLRDPHRSGSWGYCPWLLLTGTYCPGCGGLRAVNDLTRGELGAAFSSNALFVTSIPVFAVLWGSSVQQRWRGVRKPWPPRVVAVSATLALVAVMAFWVVRNLPVAAWLTP
jgi:hypothetical protein